MRHEQAHQCPVSFFVERVVRENAEIHVYRIVEHALDFIKLGQAGKSSDELPSNGLSLRGKPLLKCRFADRHTFEQFSVHAIQKPRQCIDVLAVLQADQFLQVNVGISCCKLDAFAICSNQRCSGWSQRFAYLTQSLAEAGVCLFVGTISPKQPRQCFARDFVAAANDQIGQDRAHFSRQRGYIIATNPQSDGTKQINLDLIFFLVRILRHFRLPLVRAA